MAHQQTDHVGAAAHRLSKGRSSVEQEGILNREENRQDDYRPSRGQTGQSSQDLITATKIADDTILFLQSFKDRLKRYEAQEGEFARQDDLSTQPDHPNRQVAAIPAVKRDRPAAPPGSDRRVAAIIVAKRDEPATPPDPNE